MDRISSVVTRTRDLIRSLQPATILALLVALLVLAGIGTLAVSVVVTDEPEPNRMPAELVEPKSESHAIWPYTSRERTPSERTLAINVIVYGDSDSVRYYLTERVDATWNETDDEWQDVAPDEGDGIEAVDRNGTVIEWGAAEGATRYTYVHHLPSSGGHTDPDDRRWHRALQYQPEVPYDWDGHWLDESYQVHDGDYFGTRYHLRVYDSPRADDEWVAIQAHTEHWDWFRLRHTVDGVERAQSRVELDFMGQPYVDDVWRMHLGNDRGADSDGWATVVELEPRPIPPDAERAGPIAIALMLARSVRRRSRRDESTEPSTSNAGAFLDRVDDRLLPLATPWLTYAVLFASLFALYLFVRAGGILMEQHFPALSPKLIAASLYPIISIGLPVCAYVFARTVDPTRSFVLAAAGIGLAIVADYSYLGITVLPIDVVIHRIGVVLAIGLIAAGASTRDGYRPVVNREFGAGVLLWVFLLIAPLVGWT